MDEGFGSSGRGKDGIIDPLPEKGVQDPSGIAHKEEPRNSSMSY